MFIINELWCWRILLRIPYCKVIKPVRPKGNQPWIFTGRTDAEAPILWTPDAKSWLIGKDPDAGKDWRQEERGTTEGKMVGCHHWLNRHEFEWTPGVGDGQGGLVCCSPWGRNESDTTEWLNRLMRTISHHIIDSRNLDDLNVKGKAIKLIEGSGGIFLVDKKGFIS